MDIRPIGMFDSGVGGMTVFKQVKKILPYEKIIYVGDTKCFPYGNKTRETIIEQTKKAMEYFKDQNVKAVVIACGTATSQALSEIKEKYPFQIIGIIEPTVNYIAKQSNYRKIGVIATAGTIRSRGWEREIAKKIPYIQQYSQPCPLLAPLAEEGWTDNKIAELVVKEYLKKMPPIDALILGCTHYPLFTNVIQKILTPRIELINTGEKVATVLKENLKSNKLLNENQQKLEDDIYLTETECNFAKVAEKLLGQYINEIKRIEI